MEFVVIALVLGGLVRGVLFVGDRMTGSPTGREKARQQHEAWETRHKDDLCRYCDAYKTGDGEIHHSPSCRG